MKKSKPSLGKLIDQMFQQDQVIGRQEKVLKDLKRDRRILEDKLLEDFDKDQIQGAKGSRATASISKTKHPKIKSLKKFQRYVLKTRALDLYQNRLSPRAYFDRLEEGELVPGVEVFTNIRVSLRKRKS